VYYQPDKGHGLRHNPFLALVAPRPIGWISTRRADGVVNLAPYSYFNAVSANPPVVMFGSSTPKDSRTNAEATGEFVANLATYDLRDAMGESSLPYEAHESEPEKIGIAMTPSTYVAVPRVAATPAALECRYLKTVAIEDLGGATLPAAIVLGQVVGVYIDDALIVDGMVDITRARPLGRLGYRDYCVVDEVFSMKFPR
jgi:flavin reductase (DIM6/NTAB) family NADH-FMN oxidoreductase RutF